MKYLLIPIEIIRRELDSRLLIALRLLLLNSEWEVIIGKTNKVGDFWRTQIKKNQKFIYLSKGMTFSKLFYLNLISKGGFFFLLDEEGAIFSNFISKVAKRGGTNNDLIKYMSKILFWGENEKKEFLDRHYKYLTNEKIEVTGNPRFDLCKKEYRDYHINKTKNSYVDKNLIMIDTAFGVYNNIVDINLEFEHWKNVKYEKNRGEYDRHQWLKNIAPLYEYQKKIFPHFLDGIKYICNNYSDYNFLIRPHPVENLETYKNFFKDISNVVVSNEGSAVEKFINAKLIIHNGCTTAIEALFHEIPSVCFLPLYNEEMVQTLPSEISYRAFNKIELKNYINKCLNKKNFSEFYLSKKDLIEKFIDNFNYDSSKRIAKIINSFDLNSKIDIDYDLNLRSFAHIILPDQIIKMIQRFNKSIYDLLSDKKSKKAFEKRDQIKFKNLSLNDIKHSLNSFEKIDKNIKNIVAVELDTHLFKLKRI